MDERKPGQDPDPEDYQALLKRWGLDDDALGITRLRASNAEAGRSSRRAQTPPTTEPVSQPTPTVIVDDPVDEAPEEIEEDSETGEVPPADDTAEAAEATAPEATTPEATTLSDADDVGLGFFEGQTVSVSLTERKQRRVWLRNSLLALAVVLGLVVATAGFYAVVSFQALQSLKREPGLMPTDDGYQTAPVNVTGPLNFVLMGSDTRGGERGRSDSLMVAHLNATRDKLYLISLPRDLYVEIPGHGKNKINAAYSFGGSALTVKTVQNLLHTRMDHTVIIDFEGFIGLTTDVGGVTVYNRTDSTSGYHYPKGNITISGEEALAYVRERYDLPGGDLDRAARQRDVVQALILKLLTPEVLANPATFNSVATKLGRYVTADDKLTNELIWATATSLSLRSKGDIRKLQAPLSGFAKVDGAGAVDLVDRAKMAELADALADDDLGAYWSKYGEE